MKILESYFFLKTIVYINQIEIAISISMSLGFDFSFKTSLLYCMCDLLVAKKITRTEFGNLVDFSRA